MPAFPKECSFSKTMFVCIKSESSPPRMLFRSFRAVTYPSMNGVLSAFRNFDSWTAKRSISELISRSRSSENFRRRPSAFNW